MLFSLNSEIFLWALALDITVGDPKWLTHPTQMMGLLITFLEKILRPKAAKPKAELAAGGILVLIVVSTVLAVGYSLVWLCKILPSFIGFFLATWILSTTIAIKGLIQAGLAIYQLLQQKNLKEAQKSVGYIVGRDTDKLSEKEVVRATVETIAENIADGIIAPIFYAMLGGIPLALVYKGINTLDSMIGYKNSAYLNFGFVAAKLDDIANYIPARITALLLLLAGAILRLDWRRGLFHLRVDAQKHPSPNSGRSEATVAGLLGIALGGVNYYQGVPSYRAVMGEPLNELTPKSILDTINLLLGATFIGIILSLALLLII